MNRSDVVRRVARTLGAALLAGGLWGGVPLAEAQIPPICRSPGGVTLVAPADGANVGGTGVTFDWNPASGFPNRYEIVVVTDPPFSPPLIYTMERISTSAFMTLTEPGAYSWKVRAKCNLGQVGPWSATRYFTLYPTGPTAIEDLNVINCSQSGLEIRWSAPADVLQHAVASYEIRRSPDVITESNWSSATLVPNSIVPSPRGTFESFWVTGLPSCTDHYLAVRSRDAAGTLSPMSNPTGGRTKCSVIGPCMMFEFGRRPASDPDGAGAASDLEFAPVTPNPASDACAIEYVIGSGADVATDVGVFDLSGRRIASLQSGVQAPGRHRLEWRLEDSAGRRVARGLYFVRVAHGAAVRTRSVLVIR